MSQNAISQSYVPLSYAIDCPQCGGKQKARVFVRLIYMPNGRDICSHVQADCPCGAYWAERHAVDPWDQTGFSDDTPLVNKEIAHDD